MKSGILNKAKGLPYGIKDDGLPHIPITDGMTGKETIAVLKGLFLNVRNGLAIVGVWSILWLANDFIPNTKRGKAVRKILAVVSGLGLVHLPGIRSPIAAEGWRLVLGLIVGIVGFVTYPAFEYGLNKSVDFTKGLWDFLFKRKG